MGKYGSTFSIGSLPVKAVRGNKLKGRMISNNMLINGRQYTVDRKYV